MGRTPKKQIIETSTRPAPEELYRTIFEQAADGIFIADTQGRFLEVNRQGCELLGYSRQEVLNLSLQDLIPAEDLTSDPLRHDDLRAGKTVRKERRLRCRDGRLLPVEISARMLSDGSLLSIVHDITERMRAERALREKDELLREMSAMAKIGGWEFDVATLQGTWTEEVARIHDLDPESETNAELGLSFYQGESREKIDSAVREAVKLGKPYDLELELVTAEGNHKWVRTIGHPIKHDDHVVKVRGTFQDITDRKQAEEKLRAEEERFRLAAESLSDVVYEWDLGSSVQWFGNIDELLGYAPGGFPRTLEGWMGILHPEDRDRVWTAVERHLRGEAAYDIEYRVRHKDGSWRHWLARGKVLRDAGGKPYRWVGAITDITDQKRAEESLRQSRERVRFLADIIEKADQPVGVGYPDGRLGVCNRAFCELTGYSAEELRDLDWISVLTPSEWIESEMKALTELDRTRRPVRYQKEYIRKDGQRVPIELLVHAAWNEAGKMQHYYAFVTDITERKRAEEARAKLEEQLRQAQKMESIGRLAGGVAHDFNNLLTVIQGHCDLMQVQMSDGDALLKEVKQIQQAGERAASLTRQLLAFSRRQMLAPIVLDLNDLVANLHKMLERLIGEDITLTTVLAPGLWSVTADPGQIEQVIMNLAVNARDAMPTGGMLTIETGNVHLDDSYAKTHPEAPVGPCVMLAVSDTGHGMDEPTQARIFEPFFTTKEPGKGTGLGLATVYGIVKQSGGDILVYSEPGHGTTFKIYLPANEVPPKNLVAPPTQPVSRDGHETILLVEDEEMVRDLVRIVLQNAGYIVLEAPHGKAALSLSAQHQGPIDLLITDVVMPRMSGRELAEQLKALRPPMKVLFMSGYTDDAVVQHGLLAADVEFLPKPFSPSLLASKVREVLDK